MRIENPPRDLPTMVTRRFEWSMSVPEAFLAAEEQQIIQAAWEMTRRFQQGGRLLIFGYGFEAALAQQIALTFTQPISPEQRILPALVLSAESISFAEQLRLLGRMQDMAWSLTPANQDAQIATALTEARRLGLLTLGLNGGEGIALQEPTPDFIFTVNTHDPLVVQETQLMLSHILWEIVQLYAQQKG